MPSLPQELQLKIFKQLKRKDLYQCVTVSKVWYRLCIPYLYKIIEIVRKEQMDKFIKCFRTYPRVLDSLRHVTVLRMIDTYPNEEPDDFIKEYVDLCYLVLHCKNVERLKIYPRPLLVSALLLNANTTLLRLKKFEEGFTGLTDFLDLLYAHRSTLDDLQLGPLDVDLLNNTEQGHIQYLKSFPHLVDLRLQMGNRNVDQVITYFRGLSEANMLTSTDIPPLNNIRLDVDYKANEVSDLLDAFMNLGNIKDTLLVFHEMTKQMQIHAMNILVKYLDYEAHDIDLDILDYESTIYRLCVQIEKRLGRTYISLNASGLSMASGALNTFGHLLKKLTVYNNTGLTINDINQACPHLEHLGFKERNITESSYDLSANSSDPTDLRAVWQERIQANALMGLEPTEVFNGVTSLSLSYFLNEETVSRVRLNQIPSKFPHLDTLCLRFQKGRSTLIRPDYESTVRLPSVNINTLIINSDTCYYSISFVVINNITSQCWLADSKEGNMAKFQITERCVDDILLTVTRPVYLITSNTVNTCSFDEEYW